ncbi:AraC family transcriptional regulator [Ascidiimonas aurantiaca]|uniref:helix-turn-helix domain-containing protein n=1 Tax=Ascidiimonas aurantiaca TaxID=1685432 RepID=UPI0030EE05D2
MMDLHRFEDNPYLDLEPELHTIDFFEIMIFEKGTGTADMNGILTPVTPFTVLFAAPGQKKRNAIPESSVRGYHLVFKKDFLDTFFADKLFVFRMQYFYSIKTPSFYTIPPHEYTLINKCLSEIIEEIKHFRSDSPHIIRALLYFVLTKLNRSYATFYNLSFETRLHEEMYRFKQALETHICQLHKVAEYANLLKVNRNELNRITRQSLGLTAQELIHKRLLQEIKDQLRYTTKTISEIAFYLNFTEPNNLSRFFMHKEGISPTQFRSLVQIDRDL